MNHRGGTGEEPSEQDSAGGFLLAVRRVRATPDSSLINGDIAFFFFLFSMPDGPYVRIRDAGVIRSSHGIHIISLALCFSAAAAATVFPLKQTRRCG